MGLPLYIVNKITRSKDEYLNLDNCRLTKNGISELMCLLEKNTHVTRLSMQRNSLSSESLMAFVQLPPTVEYINLAFNNIDDNAVDLILEAFKNVKRLDLSYNALTNIFAKKFSIQATQFQVNLVGNAIDERHHNLVISRIEQNKNSPEILSNFLDEKKLKELKLSISNIHEICHSLDPDQKLLVIKYLESEVSQLKGSHQQPIINKGVSLFFS